MKSGFFQKIAVLAMAVMTIQACKPGNEQPEQPKDPSVEIEKTLSIEGASADHTIPVTITNPVAGKTLNASTTTEWILNLKASNEGISFSVADNLAGAREGQIKVTYNSKDVATVKVTQDTFSFEAFSIEISNVSATGANITFKPGSHKSNYFFEVFSKSAVDKYLALDSSKPGEMAWGEALYQSDLDYIKSTVHTGMSFAEHLAGMSSMYKVTSTGEATQMKYSGLHYDTEYYAIVYGMDLEGKRTTPIAMRLFSTSASGKVNLTFTGEATGITSSTATINIKPSDSKTTYYWTWADDATYKQVTLADIQTQMSNMILQAIALYGNSITDYLYIGDTTEEVSEELAAGTLYHVVAWGLDSNGEITSDAVEVFTFTTLEEEILDDCTFDLEITDVQSMDIQVKVTPSNPDTRYYIACIDEDRCQGMSDGQMVQRIINYESERMEKGMYGEGVTWANHPDLYQGTKTVWLQDELKWTIIADHKYRIYVLGISNEGVPTTEIKRTDVTAGQAKPSNNTFTVNVKRSTWRDVTFTITPSVKEDYYMPFLIATADLDTYRHSDGTLMEREIMDQIEDYYEDEIGYYKFKGDKDWTTGWLSDEDYSLLVFGFEGTYTTKMYEFKFHSPEIPFGKASCDISYTYEFFLGKQLKALNPTMWERYEDDDCVMRIMIQTTGDPAHWYWGIWPPKENYLSTGGIDHLVNITMNEAMDGDNIIDRKGGLLRPWWYGSDGNPDPVEFVTEEGETMRYRPWSITAFAEDANGNYGPLHYDLVIPIPEPKDKVTGNKEVGYTEAYVFWGGQPAPGTKEILVNIPAMDKKYFQFGNRK